MVGVLCGDATATIDVTYLQGTDDNEMSYPISNGDFGIFICFFSFSFFSLFYKLKYNNVLVYNIMLGVQQSDLYICICIFFFRIFSFIDPFVFNMICLTVNLYNLLFPWWLRG